jgi:phage-related protein
MPYSVEYFNRDVLALIESWPAGVLAAYARVVELLIEVGPALGMPHSRPMGEGLFELRVRAREGAGRVLYCYISGRRVVLVHAFMKKTQRTPMADLRLARRRVQEVRRG